MNATSLRLLCLAGLISTPFAAIADNDLSVAVMTQPLSGCALGTAEPVTLRLFNRGGVLPAGTMFQLSYAINDAPAVTETVSLSKTLLADSGWAYTFDKAADLSMPGAYTFTASVRLGGDDNPANDTLVGHEVTHSANTLAGSLRGPLHGSSGTLSLGGNRGRVMQWESSDSGGQRWEIIEGSTGSSHDIDGLNRTTLFRVLVKNGSCASIYTEELAITPE